MFKVEDMRYAVKVVLSILSGYRGLQFNSDGEWIDVDGDFPDDPYYICAVFENGRHIPLPLIIDDGECGPLQGAVLDFMARHARPSGLLRGFYRALVACAWYEELWEREQADLWEDVQEREPSTLVEGVNAYVSHETMERARALSVLSGL